MDLLFKRYASPFLLLDQYVSSGMLREFVVDFMNIQNEEAMWDVWIHKVFEQSFDEYKEKVFTHARNAVKPTRQQLETTISTSQQILNSFVPEE